MLSLSSSLFGTRLAHGHTLRPYGHPHCPWATKSPPLPPSPPVPLSRRLWPLPVPFLLPPAQVPVHPPCLRPPLSSSPTGPLNPNPDLSLSAASTLLYLFSYTGKHIAHGHRICLGKSFAFGNVSAQADCLPVGKQLTRIYSVIFSYLGYSGRSFAQADCLPSATCLPGQTVRPNLSSSPYGCKYLGPPRPVSVPSPCAAVTPESGRFVSPPALRSRLDPSESVARRPRLLSSAPPAQQLQACAPGPWPLQPARP
jgi:hypothetical protein